MLCRAFFVFILVNVATVRLGGAKEYSYIERIWEAYKNEYGKVYRERDENIRKKTWEENIARIQHHNLEYDLGLHSYSLGMNEYSDFDEKLVARYLKGAHPGKTKPKYTFSYEKDISALPSEVDWRKKGYVTNVKNQGQCGSCWAFASTGALEGQHFRKMGKLVSLSEQNLIDINCTYAKGGCNGGWMGDAYNYVQRNDGIDTESGYAYTSHPVLCNYRTSLQGSTCSGAVGIPVGSESQLQAAVATQGPVSVLIDAAHQSFYHYRSGVYYEPACSNKSVDHAVLVVGYGSQDGQDYWLVKNSWGVSYGDKGYIKMSRNRGNNCAIATYAIYPLV